MSAFEVLIKSREEAKNKKMVFPFNYGIGIHDHRLDEYGNTEGDEEMYNPDNAKEKPSLPADTMFDGAIIEIKDETLKTLVKSGLDKWKQPPETKAIEVGVEVLHEKKSYKFEQIFTYDEDKEGKTVYNPKSNMGKFNTKYKGLPKVGVKIKALTNKEGFPKLKLD